MSITLERDLTWTQAAEMLRRSMALAEAADVDAILSHYHDDITIRWGSLPVLRGKADAERLLRARFARQTNYKSNKMLFCVSGQTCVNGWTGTWDDVPSGKKMAGHAVEYITLLQGKVHRWEIAMNVWQVGHEDATRYMDATGLTADLSVTLPPAAPDATSEPAITTEQANAMLRRSEARFNDRDIDGLVGRYDEAVAIWYADLPPVRGKAQAARMLANRFAQQQRYRIDKVFVCAQGQRYANTWTGTWTDAATGRAMAGFGVETLELRGGTVARWETAFNVWQIGQEKAACHFEI
jgi:nuclear transport factor 2 (NTF2) superfamily protein